MLHMRILLAVLVVLVGVEKAAGWAQQVKLTASDAAPHDWFGSSTSLNGAYAFVGAERDDDKGNGSGLGYTIVLAEPSTLMLLGMGAVGLLAYARPRRRISQLLRSWRPVFHVFRKCGFSVTIPTRWLVRNVERRNVMKWENAELVGLVLALVGVQGAAMASTVVFEDGATHSISTDWGDDTIVQVKSPPPLVTTLNVLPGANFGYLDAFDSSQVDMSGGKCLGLHARGSSEMDISGGDVHHLHTYDSSQTHVSGGDLMFLQAHAFSRVDVSDGYLEHLNARDSSQVDVLGGTFRHLNANRNGWLSVFGGTFTTLNVRDSSQVDIYGSDLDWNGLNGGYLTGMLRDGTFVSVPVYRYDEAQINLIPEPSTFILAAIGLVGLLGYAWRRIII